MSNSILKPWRFCKLQLDRLVFPATCKATGARLKAGFPYLPAILNNWKTARFPLSRSMSDMSRPDNTRAVTADEVGTAIEVLQKFEETLNEEAFHSIAQLPDTQLGTRYALEIDMRANERAARIESLVEQLVGLRNDLLTGCDPMRDRQSMRSSCKTSKVIGKTSRTDDDDRWLPRETNDLFESVRGLVY